MEFTTASRSAFSSRPFFATTGYPRRGWGKIDSETVDGGADIADIRMGRSYGMGLVQLA
jgi:hypothetical protein